MTYVILLNLQVILFFIYLIIKYFKKIFIYLFAMGTIIVYYTTIILNRSNKGANYIEFKIIKG